MTTTRARRLDPDALAALEEERRFLLRSLADLDAEHEAGDLDDVDYHELKDDYTRRAASVIRSIDQQQAALAARPAIRWQQVLVWLVGLALLGGVSGALIARSSGARSGNETITGGVRQSVVTRLNQAQGLLGDQDRWDEAISVYDSILDDDPSSAEALTYRAWLRYRQGESADSLLPAFEEASRLEPDYADAVVFQTIVLADAARYDEAAAVLGRLDVENAPDAVLGLLDQRGLVGQVYGEAVYDALVGADGPTLDELGLTVDQALAAAGYLLSSDKESRTVAALKLYGAVQAVEPDNPAALSREATLLALTGDPDLLARATELVDRAVAAHPADPEALLSRATVRFLDDDADGACTDLATLDALPDVPPGIVDQADVLRASSCPG